MMEVAPQINRKARFIMVMFYENYVVRKRAPIFYGFFFWRERSVFINYAKNFAVDVLEFAFNWNLQTWYKIVEVLVCELGEEKTLRAVGKQLRKMFRR